jgi:hypothetical protein
VGKPNKKSANKIYKNIKLVGSYFVPSSLGLSVFAVIFIITTVVNQFTTYENAVLNITQSDFKGTFIYSILTTYDRVTSTQYFNEFALFVFWLIIATGVYFMATRIVNGEEEILYDLRLRHYVRPKGADENGPIKEFFERFAIRFTFFILLITYLVNFIPPLDSWWKQHHTKTSLSVYFLLLVYQLLFTQFFIILD